VKRRFLLGLVVALMLGAASSGCGNDEREPAVRTVDLPGASLSVAVGEGAVWVANFDDDTVLRIVVSLANTLGPSALTGLTARSGRESAVSHQMS